MKKTIALTALLCLAFVGICNAKTTTVRDTVPTQKAATDSLTEYVGQYQRINNGETFYISIELKNGILIGTSQWDGQKFPMKHIAGDKYQVTINNWPVEFLRDKKKKVNQVLVRETDYWTRVKE